MSGKKMSDKKICGKKMCGKKMWGKKMCGKKNVRQKKGIEHSLATANIKLLCTEVRWLYLQLNEVSKLLKKWNLKSFDKLVRKLFLLQNFQTKLFLTETVKLGCHSLPECREARWQGAVLFEKFGKHFPGWRRMTAWKHCHLGMCSSFKVKDTSLGDNALMMSFSVSRGNVQPVLCPVVQADYSSLPKLNLTN